MPVHPPQRWSDNWALVPSACHDFPADRLSHASQPLAHNRGLIVPGPAAEEVNAVDAYADLGMVAQADQGLFRGHPATAPAPALARLAAVSISALMAAPDC